MSNSPTEPMARPMTVNDELLGALKALKAAFGDPMTRRALGGHSEKQMLAILGASAAIARAESPALTEGVEAKRWLVERVMGSGSICWTAYEHERQARTVAAEEAGGYAEIRVTPLYATPLQTGARGGFGSSSPKSEDTQPGASLTVVVPREPTQEMLAAAYHCYDGAGVSDHAEVYRAMIAATQQATPRDYIPADDHVTTGDAHELALQRRAALAEPQSDHPQCSTADDGEQGTKP